MVAHQYETSTLDDTAEALKKFRDTKLRRGRGPFSTDWGTRIRSNAL